MTTLKTLCCVAFIFLLGLVALSANADPLIDLLPLLYLGALS